MQAGAGAEAVHGCGYQARRHGEVLLGPPASRGHHGPVAAAGCAARQRQLSRAAARTLALARSAVADELHRDQLVGRDEDVVQEALVHPWLQVAHLRVRRGSGGSGVKAGVWRLGRTIQRARRRRRCRPVLSGRRRGGGWPPASIAGGGWPSHQHGRGPKGRGVSSPWLPALLSPPALTQRLLEATSAEGTASEDVILRSVCPSRWAASLRFPPADLAWVAALDATPGACTPRQGWTRRL